MPGGTIGGVFYPASGWSVCSAPPLAELSSYFRLRRTWHALGSIPCRPQVPPKLCFGFRIEYLAGSLSVDKNTSDAYLLL